MVIIMIDFKSLLIRAKEKDSAANTEILAMYKPLLFKESIIDGSFDEDLYQELCITLLRCIRTIQI